MYGVDELESDLRSIVTRVDDIDCAFDKYIGDKRLSGIKEQAEFLLGIMEITDLLVYGYHRYIIEIADKLNEEGNDMIQGRYRVNEFAHMKLSLDDVFDGYPGDEELSEELLKISNEDHAQREEARAA